uniref:Nuclear receptor domain-containing protein n=1 Tax=Macrostomum lignano TaxID=282301 RepID=A0A1I8IWQ6_9PLAT
KNPAIVASIDEIPCRGFFRRTIKERDSWKYVCSKGGGCEINKSSRNACKSCRFTKCIRAGMSSEGSRIGRQPNAVKHMCAQEIQAIKTKRRRLLSGNIFDDDETKKQASASAADILPETPQPLPPHHHHQQQQQPSSCHSAAANDTSGASDSPRELSELGPAAATSAAGLSANLQSTHDPAAAEDPDATDTEHQARFRVAAAVGLEVLCDALASTTDSLNGFANAVGRRRAGSGHHRLLRLRGALAAALCALPAAAVGERPVEAAWPNQQLQERARRLRKRLGRPSSIGWSWDCCARPLRETKSTETSRSGMMRVDLQPPTASAGSER